MKKEHRLMRCYDPQTRKRKKKYLISGLWDTSLMKKEREVPHKWAMGYIIDEKGKRSTS
ncbi:hypothetical protein [Heyndrickxia vini]|uniref:Uncharacterized protein n=1 Tax=Heyndrickxia vini TaxID=1476025 RepID=A0ABX7E0B5_9BACI|nr:hypothetical protein [Heyndrickxia vini]QQZ08775.1 hypothetical protein I5776_17345 [Heyndrickxia vini]